MKNWSLVEFYCYCYYNVYSNTHSSLSLSLSHIHTHTLSFTHIQTHTPVLCFFRGTKLIELIFLSLCIYKRNLVELLWSRLYNNDCLPTEIPRIQLLLSLWDWMFQLAFITCQNPKEVDSNISEGMDLPMRVRISSQRSKCPPFITSI